MEKIKKVLFSFVIAVLFFVSIEVLVWNGIKLKSTKTFLSAPTTEVNEDLINDENVSDSNFKIKDNKIYYEREVYHLCCREMELQLEIADNRINFFEKENRIFEKSHNYGRYDCKGKNSQICLSKMILGSRSLKSGEYAVSVFKGDKLIFSKNINIK